MSFDVAAADYDRFMGRYSVLLAPQMADLADLAPGQRALDVGCGPGALTHELVARLGPDAVAGVDPSESFVAAARGRYPGVDVRLARAEALPFVDNEFDRSLAQLVVHFMADPEAGLSEMRRVTRPGGAVLACVWDLAGNRAPLSPFWKAVQKMDPDFVAESRLAGTREGELVDLFTAAGLREIRSSTFSVERHHSGFEEWWEPFNAGVGPAGSYLAGLDEEGRRELREHARALLPDGPFVLVSSAWAARGIA